MDVISPVSIKDLLERQDCRIFKEVTSINNHPLARSLLQRKSAFTISVLNNVPVLKINTEFSSLPL